MSDFSFGSLLRSGFTAVQQNAGQISGLLPAQQGVAARVQQFLLHPSTNPTPYLIADLHQVLVDPSMVQKLLGAARGGAALGANVPGGQNLSPRQLIAHPNFDCTCPTPPKATPQAEPKGPVIKQIDKVERQANKTLSESKAGIESISDGAQQTLEKTGDAIQESVDGVEEGFGHFGKMFSSIGSGLRSLGLGGVVDAVEPMAADVKQTANQVDAALDTANDTVQAGLHEAAEKIDDVSDAIEDKIDIAAKKTKQFFKDVKTAPVTKIADRFGTIVAEQVAEETKPTAKKTAPKKTKTTKQTAGTTSSAGHHHRSKRSTTHANHAHRRRRKKTQPHRSPSHRAEKLTPYGRLLHVAEQLCGALRSGLVNMSQAKQILRAEAARFIANRELRDLLVRASLAQFERPHAKDFARHNTSGHRQAA